ncbi:MAG: Rep [Cressdnaviricota sp.]|nr:MAG: Rep [Cressdnaviricota sp.]
MTLQFRRKVRSLADFGLITQGDADSKYEVPLRGGGSLASVPVGPEANGNTTTADKPIFDIDSKEIIEYNACKRKDGLYKEKGPQSKNWCFTNFLLDDIQWYDDPNIGFLAYGLETCPTTGKLHHQAWLQLREKKTLGWIKNNLHASVRFAIMKGSFKHNSVYCSKEGKLIKRGEWSGQGQRTDLKDAIKKMIDDTFDSDDEENASLMIKYNKGMLYFRNHLTDKQRNKSAREAFDLTFNTLTINQQFWFSLLKKQNHRQILWIVDIDGCIGKSFFSTYMHYYHKAFSAENCSGKDLAYAYHGEPYAIFDFERCNESVINYGALEKFKNGSVFSSKYESVSKRFVPPKIMVCSNFKPDRKMLSSDRWLILTYKLGRLFSKQDGLETWYYGDDANGSASDESDAEHFPDDGLFDEIDPREW